MVCEHEVTLSKVVELHPAPTAPMSGPSLGILQRAPKVRARIIMDLYDEWAGSEMDGYACMDAYAS